MTICLNVCLRYIVLSFPASCRAIRKLPRDPSKCCQIARSQQHAKTGPPEQLHKGKTITLECFFLSSFFLFSSIIHNCVKADETNLKISKTVDSLLSDLWRLTGCAPPAPPSTPSSATVSPLTSPWSCPLGCCCQQAEPRACQSWRWQWM